MNSTVSYSNDLTVLLITENATTNNIISLMSINYEKRKVIDLKFYDKEGIYYRTLWVNSLA